MSGNIARGFVLATVEIFNDIMGRGSDRLASMRADKDPIPGPSESGIAKFIKRKEPVDGVIEPSDELAQLEEKIKQETEAKK